MIPTPLEEEILREHFPGESAYKLALSRMSEGEPLAYIVGEWYFYGLTFKLNRSTLIPRPDTEILTDRLISVLPQNAHFADLGTGSGCIALSVLANRADCTALLLDISDEALDAAKTNAEALGVSDRCTFTCADMKSFLPDEKFDAVVSNPPYIASGVIPTLQKQVRHEPLRALNGGEDGLDFYRALIRNMPQSLKDGGFLLFEIGYDQRNAITDICRNASLTCRVFRDYGGNDRMAFITR